MSLACRLKRWQKGPLSKAGTIQPHGGSTSQPRDGVWGGGVGRGGGWGRVLAVAGDARVYVAGTGAREAGEQPQPSACSLVLISVPVKRQGEIR